MRTMIWTLETYENPENVVGCQIKNQEGTYFRHILGTNKYSNSVPDFITIADIIFNQKFLNN